jgi:hypothetical protein
MKQEAWSYMLEQEDGELFCLSLIEEILQKSQQVLFQKRIDSQVLPYSSSFCKEICQGLVAYKFFKHDNGNDLEIWEEDVEFEGMIIFIDIRNRYRCLGKSFITVQVNYIGFPTP